MLPPFSVKILDNSRGTKVDENIDDEKYVNKKIDDVSRRFKFQVITISDVFLAAIFIRNLIRYNIHGTITIRVF